jgi:hypothetical protein
VDGLTFKEVLLGILFPLVVGAYAYAWVGAHALWEGLKDLRDKTDERFKEMKENDIRHLTERVERLEQDH